MANFCPKCGFENEENAQTCASCGAQLSSSAGNAGKSLEHNPKFLQGLIDLRYYTIIGFISLVAGIALDLVFLKTFSYAYLVGPLGAAFGGVTLNTSNVSSLIAYSEIALIVSAVLTLIGVYMLYRGFSVLKTLDTEFSIGKTGAVLEFVGMIFVVLAVIGLLAVLLPIVNFGTGSPSTTAITSSIGIILGLSFLVLFAAIILFVGIIMVLIGIYRVGGHFENSVVKVGAVLTVFLGIIGTILLFIGFTEIINKLKKESVGPEGGN